MKSSDCIDQVSRLLAAFPSKHHTESTANAYVEGLVDLQLPGALRDAVSALIAARRWMPSIAEVREEYATHRAKHLPAALPEPEETAEERADNVRRWRAMSAHLAAAGTGGHGDTFEECEHEGCASVRAG